MLTPNKAAIYGLLLIFPIGTLILSAVLGINEIEAFFRFYLTDDGNMPNRLGNIYMLAGLFALPAGFLLSIWPMLKKHKGGTRRFYFLNFLVAALALILIIPLTVGFMEEFYRCEIQGISNCD